MKTKQRLVLLFICLFACCALLPVYAAPATDTLDITVHKATVKPVIDGAISESEWGEAVMYQESGVGLTYYPEEGSKTSDNGVKANIYMLWDEEGFYCAAAVNDPVHFNQYSGMDIWNGDAFEFDSNFNGDDYSDRNRQTFGINNDGEIYGGSFKVASGVDWTGDAIQFSEYAAKVDGEYTYYEFFVKWDDFCPSGSSFAKAGNVFRGNIQFLYATDGDYLGCQRYAIYDAATDTSTFPNFILSEAVAATPQAPAQEAGNADTGSADAPAVISPQTSDSALIATAVICVFAAVIMIKKTSRAK